MALSAPRSAELGFSCSLLHPASQAPFIATFWTIIKPGAACREPSVLRETRKQQITDGEAVGAERWELEGVPEGGTAREPAGASMLCPQNFGFFPLYLVRRPVKPAVIKGST